MAVGAASTISMPGFTCLFGGGPGLPAALPVVTSRFARGEPGTRPGTHQICSFSLLLLVMLVALAVVFMFEICQAEQEWGVVTDRENHT